MNVETSTVATRHAGFPHLRFTLVRAAQINTAALQIHRLQLQKTRLPRAIHYRRVRPQPKTCRSAADGATDGDVALQMGWSPGHPTVAQSKVVFICCRTGGIRFAAACLQRSGADRRANTELRYVKSGAPKALSSHYSDATRHTANGALCVPHETSFARSSPDCRDPRIPRIPGPNSVRIGLWGLHF